MQGTSLPASELHSFTPYKYIFSPYPLIAIASVSVFSRVVDHTLGSQMMGFHTPTGEMGNPNT